jgi:hypothetical protein
MAPLTRRAAVLILLFADRKGDLRVVLTMRASTLKSCKPPFIASCFLEDCQFPAFLCCHRVLRRNFSNCHAMKLAANPLTSASKDPGQAALPGGIMPSFQLRVSSLKSS